MATSEASTLSLSALQSLLSGHQSSTTYQHDQQSTNLALQIAHNLHYQHSWTTLRLYVRSKTGQSLPQPILSGLPPQPLYIHPDEQIEFLQKQKSQTNGTARAQPEAQREWVLPSYLRSKWSLRKFGEVFDAISAVPPDDKGQLLFQDGSSSNQESAGGDSSDMTYYGSGSKTNGIEHPDSQASTDWRAISKTPKRVLLATVDDDSTVVYYIVHDGVVKPRQN